MTVNTRAAATTRSSTARILVMPDSRWGGFGCRLTGYSDCDMAGLSGRYRVHAARYSRAPRARNREVSRRSVVREELLGLERGHAARAGRRDRLAILLVLDIARGEHADHGGLGGAGRGEDVAL